MTKSNFENFIKAQSEMKNAHLNKVNPHFKSKYADLDAIRAATLPVLNKHGFALIQEPQFKDGVFTLVTTIVAADGEIISKSVYPLPQDAPQKMGSAITYARRYCWAAICGITADEDDDANAAQDNAKVSADELAEAKNKVIEGFNLSKTKDELDAIVTKFDTEINLIKKDAKTYKAVMDVYKSRANAMKEAA